jgi:hypothetical protein
MKKILIKGAGGVAGIGMTHCLWEYYDVYGEDDSKWARKLMVATPSYECKGPFDLVIPIADSMMTTPDYPTIVPEMREIELCQDKAACAKALGGLAPKTYWVRDTHGAGGKGAQMCSEYLPGDNYSCEVAFNNGELIGTFVKKRISYSTIKEDLPLEKRGSSMVSVCVDNQGIVQMALTAIDRIGGTPHGAYGIDFKCDKDGIPLITEINPGRFLTASYVYFYSTGYNLPLALYKSFFGEPYELGAYPVGTGIIRCVDSTPWVGKINEII